MHGVIIHCCVYRLLWKIVTSYVFAALVIILAVLHIGKEIYQIFTLRRKYFYSFQNWNELFLFLFTIVYVFNFAGHCGCVRYWQWQIGIFVVFSGLIDLIIIAAEVPTFQFGFYVIIFNKIVGTFLRLLLFSTLLVFLFSIILFMMFSPTTEVRKIIQCGCS